MTKEQAAILLILAHMSGNVCFVPEECAELLDYHEPTDKRAVSNAFWTLYGNWETAPESNRG